MPNPIFIHRHDILKIFAIGSSPGMVGCFKTFLGRIDIPTRLLDPKNRELDSPRLAIQGYQVLRITATNGELGVTALTIISTENTFVRSQLLCTIWKLQQLLVIFSDSPGHTFNHYPDSLCGLYSSVDNTCFLSFYLNGQKRR